MHAVQVTNVSENVSKITFPMIPLSENDLTVSACDMLLASVQTSTNRGNFSFAGDVGSIDMLPVPQTQFAPLSEALCKVVADLNGEQVVATTESIRARLEESFPEMQVPCEDILHKTLGGLIRERKIYHTGSGKCQFPFRHSRKHLTPS